MSEAIGSASTESADLRSIRVARVVRSAALLLSGFAVAFTATLHEQLDFDRWLLVASLAFIGAATLVEYRALLSSLESWWVAARAIIAFAAAGSLIAASSSLAVALVLALWALLTAVITLMRLARKVQPRGVAIPSAILSVALALATLVVRDDPVAVIGFFGAYAVIRGVFLGISAFDSRGSRDQPAAEPASGDTSTPRNESAS
jgi:hypothetical protein